MIREGWVIVKCSGRGIFILIYPTALSAIAPRATTLRGLIFLHKVVSHFEHSDTSERDGMRILYRVSSVNGVQRTAFTMVYEYVGGTASAMMVRRASPAGPMNGSLWVYSVCPGASPMNNISVREGWIRVNGGVWMWDEWYTL